MEDASPSFGIASVVVFGELSRKGKMPVCACVAPGPALYACCVCIFNAVVSGVCVCVCVLLCCGLGVGEPLYVCVCDYAL